MFKKPNVKSVTNVAVNTVAIVAGAKIGDGIVAVMPDSTASYKKILIGGLALIAAASVDAKTQTSQAAQSALIGIGVKQICDEVTESLISAVAVKDNSTTANKFVNAVVGHGEVITPVATLAAPWDFQDSQMWNRQPEALPAATVDVTAMM